VEQILLVLNPGSTSTKLAVFQGAQQTHRTSLHHSNAELAGFSDIVEQKDFRQGVTVKWLQSEGVSLESLTAIVARGGLLAPIPGGTYTINETMVEQLAEGRYGKHASNLGALIAFGLSQRLGIPSFIVDPVVVDELEPIARISGNPKIERISIFHALNHKANAKKVADRMGRPYRRAQP
jgi:butyrate kinase